jgi:predicted small integral membrane protein
MRHLQITAALLIGLLGLLFFLGNVFNLSAAVATVGTVVSGAEQPYYQILGPALEPVWLHALALGCIALGELAVGALGLTGAVTMLRARGRPAPDFQRSKSTALAAGATGMLVWLGLFIVVGEGYFHMWQSEVGTGSAEGAFRYAGTCALLAALIAYPSDSSA